MGRVFGIIGKTKTGKTVSGCTFPKPLLLLDYDRGYESVTTAKDKGGNLVVPDYANITIVEFYSKKRSKLDFKSYKLEKGGVPSGRPNYTDGAEDVLLHYESIMDELFEKKTVTVNGAEVGPFKTLIIDPLTSMFRFWKASLLAINNVMELRRGDYLTLEDNLFNRFIPNLKTLSDIVPFIVLIDHEDFDATEKGDLISEFPVGPTKNMGKGLSEGLDEVWRMEEVNGTYRWRTKKHGLFIGAGSRLSLPDPINPATFQELKKYLPEEAHSAK